MKFKRVVLGDYDFRGTSYAWPLFERASADRDHGFFSLISIHRLFLDRLPGVSALSSASAAQGDELVFVDADGEVYVSTKAVGSIAKRWQHEQLERLCAASIEQLLRTDFDGLLKSIGITPRGRKIVEEVDINVQARPAPPIVKRKPEDGIQSHEQSSNNFPAYKKTVLDASTDGSHSRRSSIPNHIQEQSYDRESQRPFATLPPLRSMITSLPAPSPLPHETSPMPFSPTQLPPSMARRRSLGTLQPVTSSQTREVQMIREQQKMLIRERIRRTDYQPVDDMLPPNRLKNSRNLIIQPVTYNNYGIGPKNKQQYALQTPGIEQSPHSINSNFSGNSAYSNSRAGISTVVPPTTPRTELSWTSTPSQPAFRGKFSDRTSISGSGLDGYSYQAQNGPHENAKSPPSGNIASQQEASNGARLNQPKIQSLNTPPSPPISGSWPIRSAFIAPFEDLYESMLVVWQQQGQAMDAVNSMQRQVDRISSQQANISQKQRQQAAYSADNGKNRENSASPSTDSDPVTIDYLSQIIAPLQAVLTDMQERIMSMEAQPTSQALSRQHSVSMKTAAISITKKQSPKLQNEAPKVEQVFHDESDTPQRSERDIGLIRTIASEVIKRAQHTENQPVSSGESKV